MPGRTGTSPQAAVSSTCGLSQLEDNKGKGLEPPVGDREGPPTATVVTSLCKHSFPVSSTCSLFACYHLQILPFRLCLEESLLQCSLLVLITSWAMQQRWLSRGAMALALERVFLILEFLWSCSVEGWRGQSQHVSHLADGGCFLLRWLTGIWFCLNRSWTTSMTSWSLSSSSSPTSA